ncbi:MAG: accessory factor UbiK family protein [Sphingopyxis sp.]|nr:accessory factor UbiK family protein [Sphingopyxis sp.]
MQSQNQFFDDLAKALNGAAGTFAGMAREAQGAARERAREFVGGMDFVSREEFETVKDMLAEARREIDALKAQIGTATPAAKPKRGKAE